MGIYSKSDKVKLYPSAYRGSGYDPEARLNTEFNIRNFTKSVIDFEGFVIDYNNTTKNIKFNLGGYYFDVVLEDSIFTYAIDNDEGNGDLFVGIKLKDLNSEASAKDIKGSTLINIEEDAITTLDNGDDLEFKGIMFSAGLDDLEGYDYILHLLTGLSGSSYGIVPSHSLHKLDATSIRTDNGTNITEYLNTDRAVINNLTATTIGESSNYVPDAFIEKVNTSTFNSEDAEITELEVGYLNCTDDMTVEGDLTSINKNENNILSHTNAGIEYKWKSGTFPSVPTTPPYILSITPIKGNIISSLNQYYPFANISINANSFGIHHNVRDTYGLKDLTTSSIFTYNSTQTYSKNNTYEIMIDKEPDVDIGGIYNQYQNLKFKGLLGTKIVSEIDANRMSGGGNIRFSDDINKGRALSDAFTLMGIEKSLYAQQGLKLYGPSVFAPDSEFRHLVFHGNYIKESSGYINPVPKSALSKPSDFEYTQGPLGYISTFIDIDTSLNVEGLGHQPRYGLRLAATNPLGNNLWPSGAFLDMDTTGELSIRVNPYTKTYGNYTNISADITANKVFSVTTNTDAGTQLTIYPSTIKINPTTLNITPTTLNITPDIFKMSSDEFSIENSDDMGITSGSLSISTTYGTEVNQGNFKVNTSLTLGDEVPIIDSANHIKYKSTSYGILPYVDVKEDDFNALAAKYINLYTFPSFWTLTVNRLGDSDMYTHTLAFSYTGMSSEPQKGSHYKDLLRIWRAYNAGEPVYVRRSVAGGGGGGSGCRVYNMLVNSMGMTEAWENGNIKSRLLSLTFLSTSSSTTISSEMFIYAQPVIGSDGEYYNKSLYF